MSNWCGLNEIVESTLTLQKQIGSRADNRVPVEYTTCVCDRLLWCDVKRWFVTCTLRQSCRHMTSSCEHVWCS